MKARKRTPRDKLLPEGMLTGTGIAGFALSLELLAFLEARGALKAADREALIAGALEQVDSIESEKPSPAVAQSRKILIAALTPGPATKTPMN